MLGTGGLHPGEQHHAQQDLQPGQTGQSWHFVHFQAEPQANAHKHQVHQAHAGALQVGFRDHAAAVVVGIVVGVVVAQNVAHQGPQQDDHGHHGHQAEQDQVAHLQQGILPAAHFGNAGAAHQHQHGVGKVVAHHEVQIPPAGQDDGRRGQKQQPEPGQVQLFKPEIQREQQDAEGEDQAEPVRLAQHGAHAQPRVRKSPGQANEEKPEAVLHLQHLPYLDHQTGQQKQQHGHDAEHLADRKAVAGAVGQAERELDEQGDEVGVVLGQGVEDIVEAGHGGLGKGSFGTILFADVVDVIPDVYEAAAGLGPVEVEQRCRPETDDHGPVEQVELHIRQPQHHQHQPEQGQVAPQAHQREKYGTAGGGKAQHHQRQCGHGIGQQGLAYPRGAQLGKSC